MSINPGAHLRNNSKIALIIDTAATVSCVNHVSLLTPSSFSTTIHPREANIEGINAQADLQVQGAGLLYPPFDTVRALYAEKAAENILSWWCVKRCFWIQLRNQDQANEHLELTHKQSAKIVQCYIDPHIGLYVYVPEKPALHHLRFNDVPSRVFRMTSSMKLQHLGYSKAIANRVARVQLLHEATAFAGPEALKKLIRRRGNDDIDGRDFAIWSEEYHPTNCHACPAGKSKMANASTSTSRGSDTIGELVFTDIFFFSSKVLDEPMKVVFTVDDCSNMLHSRVIDSKSKNVLMQALTDIVSDYRGNDHKFSKLRSDNEPAMTTLKSNLNKLGILLEHSEDYRHNKRAERYVRTVRERMLAVLSGSDTPIPSFLYPDLLQYVTRAINCTFNDSNDALTPYEQFDKRQRPLDLVELLKCTFGQLVRYFNSKKPPGKSDESRCSYGIVLGIDPIRPHCVVIFDFVNNTKDSRSECFPTEWPEHLKSLFLGKYSEFIAADIPVFLDAYMQPFNFDTLSEYNNDTDMDITKQGSGATTTDSPHDPSVDIATDMDINKIASSTAASSSLSPDDINRTIELDPSMALESTLEIQPSSVPAPKKKKIFPCSRHESYVAPPC